MMSSLYNMRDKLLEIKILKNAEKFEYVRDSNHLVLWIGNYSCPGWDQIIYHIMLSGIMTSAFKAVKKVISQFIFF